MRHVATRRGVSSDDIGVGRRHGFSLPENLAKMGGVTPSFCYDEAGTILHAFTLSLLYIVQ
jgi:hypothetical protein